MNGLCSIVSSKAVGLRMARVECGCGDDFSSQREELQGPFPGTVIHP
jgi:hypothetical protein